MRTVDAAQFQYRAATYMYLLGMVAEPVIYLVVWSTIADQSGGSVNGLTAGQFAAYYIVWTLVRTMNIVFTPYGWEWRIREGELSGQLLRPLHPIHYDVAWFAGGKIPWLLYYAPDRSRPDPRLQPDLRRATCRGRGVRGRHLGCVPDPDVQPVRARADHVLDDARRGALLAVHRARAAALRPARPARRSCPTGSQTVAWFLPFRWTFYFPIQSLVGDLSERELLAGLGMQVFWTLVGIGIFSLVWRHAIRRYTAVGN